jgi:hypothetical protein
LRGGSYRPQAPTRIYLPKPSGLQRPLTLLCIEDQIVLQAIANSFALKLASQRRALELKSVFSNVLQDEDEDPEQPFAFPAEEAVEKFESALAEETQLIADKTRARYVLYRAEPSSRLLAHILRLLPRQPEHVDAFVYYLGNYRKSKRIVEACRESLQTTPYEYVQGEMWHLLAQMMSPNQMRELIEEAIEIAKNGKSSFAAKWGACHFLCAAEQNGLGNYAGFVKYQDNALLHALLVPLLPEQRFNGDRDLVSHILKRSSFEPGMALAEKFCRYQLTCSNLNGVEIDQLPTQIRNVFRAVGILPTRLGRLVVQAHRTR